MRIITGKAKGTKLTYSDKTIPLSDRAKSALFSIINDFIEGTTVLDLYAGSGALGLEALSRGSSNATFVDVAQSAVDSILLNVKKARFENKSTVIRYDAVRYLEDNNDKYDIIFVFQPYDKTQNHVIKLASEHLNPYGLLIFEHHKEYSVKELTNLKKIDERKYGIVVIEIYQNLPE